MATYRGENPLSKAMREDARGVVKQFVGIMKQIGNIAINEAKTNFKRQGFMDRSVKRWKPRKRKDKNPKIRAILVGPADEGGGRLRRSIRRISVSNKRVTIGSKGDAAEYALVHNYGLKSGRKTAPFIMPKRQFLGPSHTTDKRIVNLIKKKIKKGFK
jgi:phage virion morphogenesis protein